MPRFPRPAMAAHLSPLLFEPQATRDEIELGLKIANVIYFAVHGAGPCPWPTTPTRTDEAA